MKGSGSMAGRPFLSMVLSAADPEPASSPLSELSAKVKMVLPIHRLIIGLFAWEVSLQLSSKMSGSPLLRHLKVKPLDNEVCLLEELFEPFTIKQVDILRKDMEAIDKEFNMTSSSLAVRIQDLPFNKDVQPLVIQDPLVQKFQKTMKQYPAGTEIDISNKILMTGNAGTCGMVARS